ncbi:hypothetical protein Bhyg_06081 [Pseudolycoriella hygida]|uniref:Uncharacterized protein n=1 Tax=Pseudolycoriella hygida TaxID=35572 RepID=A0A9Q0N0S7_9DIPT|nr:hypothetical protein Bhyg_06081 [Pseudolycoriella hygida]
MRNLVLFVVFLTGSMATHREITKEQFADYRIKCSEANGITREELLEILKHPFPTEEYPPCYVKCILESADFLNDDKLVTDNIIHQMKLGEKNLNVEQMENVIGQCNDEFKNEADKCVQGFNLADCFFGREQRFGIFVASLTKKALQSD